MTSTEPSRGDVITGGSQGLHLPWGSLPALTTPPWTLNGLHTGTLLTRAHPLLQGETLAGGLQHCSGSLAAGGV